MSSGHLSSVCDFSRDSVDATESPPAERSSEHPPAELNTDDVLDGEDLFSDDSDIGYQDERNVRPVQYKDDQLDIRYLIDTLYQPKFMPPHRLARAKAKKARTAEDFWKSNLFNLLGLPYIDRALKSRTVDQNLNLLHNTLTLPAWSTKKSRRGDAQAHTLETEDQIQFSRCCACAGHYEYDLGHQVPVYVCAGAPDGDYIAISYVWGSVKDLVAVCLNCGYISVLPMESTTKFRTIMSLAGSGSCVWLDALSIDQADHADIAQQVSQMGSIYKNARSTAVLLPNCDSRAFELLHHLSGLAKAILDRPAHFYLNYENAEAAVSAHLQKEKEEYIPSVGPVFWSDNSPYFPDYGQPSTSKLCKDFCSTFCEFQQQLPTFRYWQRAWTFQEWSQAQDIDVGTGERQIKNVKTLVFSAASLMCQYRLAQGDYCKIKFGVTSDAAIAFFNAVKLLFPLEDILQLPDEVPTKERHLQWRMASILGDGLLGLRKTPRTVSEDAEQVRLRFALEAFSLNKREAKYPADLVACWASMCNIKYAYRKDDSVAHALFKIKAALRKTGMQIFDFIPPQMDTGNGIGLERPSFFAYTAPHEVSNATTEILYPGLSIFTGRTDTLTHIMQVLRQDLGLLGELSSIATLQFVEGAFTRRQACLLDVPTAVSIFRKTVLGRPIKSMFHNQTHILLQMLTLIPDVAKQRYDIWQFYLPTKEGVDTSRKILKAWALIPHGLSPSDIKIAREGHTGAIVALTFTKLTTPVVAYLLVTDQISGTHILRSDADGSVNIQLKVPKRRGIMAATSGGEYVDGVYRLQCQLCIDANPIRHRRYTLNADPVGDMTDRTRKERAGGSVSATTKRRLSN